MTSAGSLNTNSAQEESKNNLSGSPPQDETATYAPAGLSMNANETDENDNSTRVKLVKQSVTQE